VSGTGPTYLPITFSLIVLQATIIKTMALSSKLTEADCQFLALLVLHTVAVHGHEVALSEFGFLKHKEVLEEVESVGWCCD
jgi:hypothetical protein